MHQAVHLLVSQGVKDENMVPSEREKHMISLGLTSMALILEKELTEVTGGLIEEADALIRIYLRDRIEHYRTLARAYEES